eukprot:1144108-Pelagomonas_calceolata.AAC.1
MQGQHHLTPVAKQTDSTVPAARMFASQLSADHHRGYGHEHNQPYSNVANPDVAFQPYWDSLGDTPEHPEHGRKRKAPQAIVCPKAMRSETLPTSIKERGPHWCTDRMNHPPRSDHQPSTTLKLRLRASWVDQGGQSRHELNRQLGPIMLLQSVISVILMTCKMKNMCCSDVPIPRSAISVKSMHHTLNTTSLFCILISPSGRPV